MDFSRVWNSTLLKQCGFVLTEKGTKDSQHKKKPWMSFKNYFMKSEEILLKTFQAVLKDKGGPFKIPTSLFKLYKLGFAFYTIVSSFLHLFFIFLVKCKAKMIGSRLLQGMYFRLKSMQANLIY